MERPAKRLRIGSFLHDDDDADDELFLDPNEVNAQRDPAVLLEQSRAVASFKLKSRWEDVFARFEKDFTGEDDIINFYTDDLPEVEVDNGHLRSLADADDAKSVAESESADIDEEERILQGKGAGDGQLIRAGPSSLMSRPAYPGRLSGLGSLATGPARLSTMFSTGAQFPSFSSFSLFKSSAKPLDSRWNAPELPPEAFDNHANARTVTRRRVAVKALPAPEHDDSDEDDILMGNATPQSENKLKETEQPVLPTVAVQESGPAADDTLPRVVTRAPSYATESALGLQKSAEPSSRPAKPLRRLEVQLFRRRRPDTMQSGEEKSKAYQEVHFDIQADLGETSSDRFCALGVIALYSSGLSGSDEPSSAPVLSNPQVEDFVATAAEHTGPSSSSKIDGLTFSAQPDPALDKSQAKEVPSTPFSKRLKDMSAPAAAVLVTPSSRHNKSNSTGNHPSTSKRSILSLLSDSDEDELSLSLDQISPVVKSVSKQHHVLPIRSRSTMKKQSFKRTSLGSYNRATPTQKKSKLSGGWNSASAARVARRVSGVDNGEVHRTPGGTMRRCGEDGFKCERDFCFACL
ncbi:hypothetical protein NKR19_g9173 [Coniochaeta hoffmannii]|uniref:Uncharacterized protein n=1 Tax=Coniochaeta hoffmannii TaxID=91930 RepID=A0AA38RD54_9PEZI|nr:hypothetical protein NKR19_g9173 [Coniochaeta hoffmannii]